MQIKERVLNLLNGLLEIAPNTLSGDEALNDENGNLNWTSIEVIGFIAICDEEFDVIISATETLQAKTVADLIALVENKVNKAVTA